MCLSQYACKVRKKLNLLKGTVSATMRELVIGKTEVVEVIFYLGQISIIQEMWN